MKKYNNKKNCDHCKIEFSYYEPPCYLGRTKYCSISCQRKGRPKTYLSLMDGFDKYVVRNADGCWDWNGALKDGYGLFRFNGKRVMAHRVSWQIYNGEIPLGQFICHTCDNRKCTNPKHLFLGSIIDNTLDMVSKNRNKGAVGSRNHKSKFNENEILLIKNRLSSGEKIKDIANELKVSFGCIYDIYIGNTWKHVV